MASTLRQRKPQPKVEDESSGFSKTLQSIDFFDKVKDEVIDTKTKSGGFISLITIIFVSLILITELDYYFFQEVHKYSYRVDTSTAQAKQGQKRAQDQHILLTFDIIVKTPCSQIGAGLSDDAGADIRSLDDISEQPAFFDMEPEEATRYQRVQKLQEEQLDKDQILTRNVPRNVLPPSVEPAEGVKEKKPQSQPQDDNALALFGGGGHAIGGKHMGGLGELGAIMQQMAMAQAAMNQMMQAQMNPLAELAKPSYNKAAEKGKVPDSCRFFGQTTLAKVKGTLHIVEGKRIKLGGMMGMVQISTFNQKKPNFTHRINQLRFSAVRDGQEIDLSETIHNQNAEAFQQALQANLNDANSDYSLQALDAHVSETHGGFFQYFLSVVPISFTFSKKEPKYYQYSVTETSESNEFSHHHGIIFKYDFSPIMVEIDRHQSSSILLFIVRMCSIVGGILSIATFLTRASWCVS